MYAQSSPSLIRRNREFNTAILVLDYIGWKLRRAARMLPA
jgi:hypothetical protein